ncbi:MAG: hypothetical protein A2887_05500 [Alphaproteobacteria bacterium RIFCSPLOWO2_01_FULL_40_26]|nr:MAG: hypothetical protein A2887_05500 [Alphaproteobacteria bacterium RIFCSPLOWO2_01_FULL_40_26]OFX09756.1 MAG: hypothetical protein A3H30_00260 [Alphaproteobacteria bacterium RIFCSPLOWO2_02_FULL_40_19]
MASWIANCFVELDILNSCRGYDVFNFVRKIDDMHDEYSFNSKSNDWDVFCPTIYYKFSQGKNFIFRNDITIFHTGHGLLSFDEENYDSILAIRDPRDLMLSLFTWQTKYEKDDFFSFCIENLEGFINFYQSCLGYKKARIFRFEDRKQDEQLFLREIGKFCNLKISDDKILKAISNSSIEVAMDQESQINKSEHKFFKNRTSFKVNNSGIIAKYKLKENERYQKAFDYIIKKAAPTMRKYGYAEEWIYGEKFDNMSKVKKIFNNYILKNCEN